MFKQILGNQVEQLIEKVQSGRIDITDGYDN